MITTLINLAIIIGLLYLCAIFIEKYNSLMFLKYRFRYFALRDELAKLVLSGEIDESSWEYEHIVETINHHIKTVETMSIVEVTRMLSDFYTSPEEHKQHRVYEKTITNKKVIKILVEYLKITQKLLQRNSRAQIAIIRFVAKLISPSEVHLSRYESNIKPKRAIEYLNAQSSELSDKLPTMAA